MANLKRIYQKRTPVSKEICLKGLKECLIDMFLAYNDAMNNYNREIQQTMPEARTRLGSTLLNAKMVESFIKRFPDGYRKGLYGRVIIRLDGFQFIIKMLKKNGTPTYVPTQLAEAILGQLAIPLFSEEQFDIEPLLIFGYSKNSFGEIIDPRIVYYDGNVKWEINRSDLSELTSMAPAYIPEVNVGLKSKQQRKIN